MKRKMLISFFMIILIVTIFAAVQMIAYADDNPNQTQESSTEPDGGTNVGVLIVAEEPTVGITTVGDNANIDVSTSGDAEVTINGEHVQQTVIRSTTKVYQGVGRTTVREEIDAKLLELIYPRLELSEATFGQLLPLIGTPDTFYSNLGTSSMIEVLISNKKVISEIEEEMLTNYTSINKELAEIKSKCKHQEATILVVQNELKATSDELKVFKITTYIGMAVLFLLFLTYVVIKRVKQNQ